MVPYSADDFLNLAKRTLGLRSDYQLAKVMGISTQRIGNYRSGRTKPDEQTCLLLAKVVRMPAAYVLACAAAQRTNRRSVRAVWREAARQLRPAA